MPALCAISRSCVESPTMTVAAALTPSFSSASRAMRGEGALRDVDDRLGGVDERAVEVEKKGMQHRRGLACEAGAVNAVPDRLECARIGSLRHAWPPSAAPGTRDQ